MKKSEFKEYLKTEILNMREATDEEIKKQQELNKELEKTKELTADMEESVQEYKVTKSEFKEYLKQEILAEISNIDPGTEPKGFLRKKPYAAQLEEAPDDIELDGEDIELGDLEGEDDINAVVDPGESDKALALDDIGDTLVQLARKAKDVDERELANQILNSAKFAKKTEFKKIEKDAGVGEEGEA